jgi:hypothetical protein
LADVEFGVAACLGFRECVDAAIFVVKATLTGSGSLPCKINCNLLGEVLA